MDRGALPVVALLMALAFAGCTDSGTGETDTDTGIDAGSNEPVDEGLTADSVVDAPMWQVGDSFGHHIFFGSDDAEGTHIDAVVVNAGSTYTLVSDQEQAAKWEATWDFPMLGDIDAQSLDTTAFGSDWNLYDFPLQDGKTWTSTFDPLFSGARELTMTATFNDKIPTVGQGIKEGFIIQGVNEDGEVELVTDYIPEIGWYSELTYFDPMTADTEDFILRVWAMGKGSDWNGTIVSAEAEETINAISCIAPPDSGNPATDPFQGCNSMILAYQFQVSEEADELYGIMFLLAIAGRSSHELFDPQLSRWSDEVVSEGMDDVQTLFRFLEVEDPSTGAWHYSWNGEGFVTVGMVQLWEIQYTEAAFPTA